MTLLAQTAIAILNEALDSEFGITVEVQSLGLMTAPALRAKQVLYRFKSESADFFSLQIRFSPNDPDNELWIVKQ